MKLCHTLFSYSYECLFIVKTPSKRVCNHSVCEQVIHFKLLKTRLRVYAIEIVNLVGILARIPLGTKNMRFSTFLGLNKYKNSLFVIICIPFRVNSYHCYMTHHLALKITIHSNLQNVVFAQLSHTFAHNLQSKLSGVVDDLNSHDDTD